MECEVVSNPLPITLTLTLIRILNLTLPPTLRGLNPAMQRQQDRSMQGSIDAAVVLLGAWTGLMQLHLEHSAHLKLGARVGCDTC